MLLDSSSTNANEVVWDYTSISEELQERKGRVVHAYITWDPRRVHSAPLRTFDQSYRRVATNEPAINRLVRASASRPLSFFPSNEAETWLKLESN